MAQYEMGQYAHGNHLNFITLSNGEIADMNADTLHEGYEAFENLLNMIVMTNFKEILRVATEDQSYDRSVEIVLHEVNHVVQNELGDDYKNTLFWFLFHMAFNKLEYYIDVAVKSQESKIN
ncbi:MAG: hypothetical protein HQK65_09020 [Desulfamplus sp.]|nr:hypothetical protein [Desulfamplus sp.]